MQRQCRLYALTYALVTSQQQLNATNLRPPLRQPVQSSTFIIMTYVPLPAYPPGHIRIRTMCSMSGSATQCKWRHFADTKCTLKRFSRMQHRLKLRNHSLCLYILFICLYLLLRFENSVSITIFSIFPSSPY